MIPLSSNLTLFLIYNSVENTVRESSRSHGNYSTQSALIVQRWIQNDERLSFEENPASKTINVIDCIGFHRDWY